MKIQYVASPTEVGGLERVVQLLTAGLVRHGHEVLVLGVTEASDSVADFFDALSARGVPWQRLVVKRRDYRGERRAVKEICREFRPDVLHTHGYRCDVIDGPVARSEGIATTSTAHGYSGEGVRNGIYEWLQGRALRKCSAVAAVSRPIVERLARAGVSRDRIHLIRNAYPAEQQHMDRAEARRALGIPADDFVVGWIGRFSLEKGPDVMFDAARTWSKSGVSTSFVGDGPMQQGLAAQVSPNDRIRMHGRINEASRFLRAFDVLALTSRTEGTPMVLLEAMAASVPIVTTRVGGIPDMLDPHEALLVPSENRTAIVEAVEKLRADPSSAAQLASAAADRLRRDFDYDAWIARYVDLYQSIVSRPRAS